MPALTSHNEPHTLSPMKIRKAVIPAAGLGTRFRPATKTVPKELFPLVDRPILLYNIDEIVAAGFEEVVLVIGPTKQAIIDFFDDSFTDIKVTFVRQDKALGLGHAVLTAAEAVGDEPFAVLLGDELMLNKPGQPSGIAQLAQVFAKTGTSTVAVMEVAAAEVVKYGIVAVEERAANLWTVTNVIEKPAVVAAPSRLALPGRYVFVPQIFDYLRHTKPGKNGEIQLTDGMTELARKDGLLAMQLDTIRFDAGDKLGYLQANIEIGLAHPEVGPGLRKYLQERFGGNK